MTEAEDSANDQEPADADPRPARPDQVGIDENVVDTERCDNEWPGPIDEPEALFPR